MFKIGDFSRIARVSARQLRFYEEMGLFAPAHADPATGYRFYSVAQLAELNRIIVLKELGFSLEEVRGIMRTGVGAEERGLSAEILSDATGAIHLANEAGKVSADQLHETLLVLLHSNFAAVATTDDWVDAVRAGKALPKNDLGTSATRGRAAFGG